MSGRHQPENGADSEIVYNRYRVYLEEVDGSRWWVTVPRAMGPNDASHQAIEKAVDAGYFDVTALKVQLDPGVVPSEATVEEWIAWAGLR